MSVRIYQLSKELNMENKELIAILQKQGLKVDSPSNTIPNIYADSLLEEHRKKMAEQEPIPQEKAEEPAPARPAGGLPPGAFVRSAADVELEKQKQAEAKAAASASGSAPKPAPAIPPAPAAPAKAPAQPATPVAKSPGNPLASLGARKAPPPPPMRPPVASSSSVAAEPAPAPAPAKPEELPPAGAPLPTPAPANRPSSPPLPPAVAGRPVMPVAAPSPSPATSDDVPSVAVAGDGSKIVNLKPPIVVREFATAIDIKPFRLISELMEMGIFASLNQTIEEDVATKVAARHGYTLEIRHRGEPAEAQKPKVAKPEVDESALLEPRAPVVCILGHVDHGKTTLLDTIRKTNVVVGEAGGITQHIGAYQVEHNNHKITFIDTPGHAAFSKMRERGANVTDVAILVVAADDGFMPQTDEALKFIQKANVSLVVAINKIDSKGSNIDRVKQMMQQRNIAPEDWGGEILTVGVSALKGEKIDDLLDAVLLQAEVLELKANPKCPAEGVIIESQMETGRGPTASVIVQKGTLKVGDALVCGSEYCKVRAMMDDRGQTVKSAPPSTPVRLLGWSGVPDSGARFEVVKNEKTAKAMAEETASETKRKALSSQEDNKPAMGGGIEELMAAIESSRQKIFRVVLKGDVAGTVEALSSCLSDIKSDKVKLEIVGEDVGQISKNDIIMASAAGAAVIGFNVKLESGVQAIAKHHSVQIIQHNIIYELIAQVKDGMAELLEPELREHKLGAAEVRQVFTVGKGTVAGCMITEGRIERDSQARVLRGGEMIHQGRVGTLKRFKDDVSEVRAGYECGIRIEGYDGYKEGDVLEAFTIEKIRPNL